jgi:hypothetical protein
LLTALKPSDEALPKCKVRSAKFFNLPWRRAAAQPFADVAILAEAGADMKGGPVNVDGELLPWNGEVGNRNRSETPGWSDRHLLLGVGAVLLE